MTNLVVGLPYVILSPRDMSWPHCVMPCFTLHYSTTLAFG